MPTYRCYGLTLRSEIELPELTETPDVDAPDVVIERTRVDERPADAVGLPWGMWRDDHHFGLSVIDVARFQVTDGTHVRVEESPAAPAGHVRLFLLGTVLGAVLTQRGYLTLHANAVRVGDHALLVMGPSGAGKSTLAAELSRRGLDLLADDVVPVDADGLAWPGLARVKLWADALDRIGVESDGLERIAGVDKFSLPVERGPLDALPVGGLYALETSDTVEVTSVEPTRGFETFSLLRANTYRPELIHDTAEAQRHVDRCAALARQAAVLRVVRPSGTMSPEQTADAILADFDAREERP